MSEIEGSDTDSSHDQIASNAGRTVTPKFVEIVSDMLDNSEQVYHVIRGPKAGTGATQNSAETTSTGTKGFVTAAFTDKRILIRVPHFLSDDRYAVRYENIQAAELNSESVLGLRSFSIHTAGKSYWIGIMGTMNDEDLQEIRQFVDKASSTTISNTTNATSTQERLTELTELWSNGLISDDEFESKRAQILNDI